MTSMPETKRLIEALRQSKAGMERISARLSEPLAVVGIGCRFPDCDAPEQYWQMLLEGRQVELGTGNRWVDSLTATQEKQPGRITANRGGFLRAVDQFDTQFFGISGREARMLDPQQRLLLEIAWETFENAAINPMDWRGRKVGTFIGICSDDYLHRLTERAYDTIDTYLSTGNSHGAAAGRLSYFMDWNGPAVAIDTACSSSLTALHLAARSLRYGDCEMALVMGVNVILAPELSISLSQAGMLSPTARCHTFSEQADGFARGEGCGGILLKRLSKAEQDGDRILCLLRGTSSNQDGRSNGLTAPNGQSQEQVILAALADAKLSPQDVDYIEAHGTGTPLGDPVEVGALKAVFANSRDASRYRVAAEQADNSELQLGSAKANLGHLEGAAGIAGVIKTVLSLHHQTFPPHPRVGKLSERIDWDWSVKVSSVPVSWQASDRPRVAGVSSFGFGGSNAHAVFSEYAQGELNSEKKSSRDGIKQAAGTEPELLVLSAKTIGALREQATKWAMHLKKHRPMLADVCFTAAIGRAAFDHRLAIIAHSIDDAAAALEQAAITLQSEQKLKLSLVGMAEQVSARGKGRLGQLCEVAKRFLAGGEMSWHDEATKPWAQDARRIALPTYSFQRVRRWYDDETAAELLGEKLDIASDITVYQTDLKNFPYLRDHVVDSVAVFPATGYLELAVAAGIKTYGKMLAVENLTLLRPILLHSDSSTKVQVSLHHVNEDTEGRIHVRVGTAWQLAATFTLAEKSPSAVVKFNLNSITSSEASDFTNVSVEEHYQRATQLGLVYGPSFRCIEKLAARSSTNGGMAYGIVAAKLSADCRDIFHAAILDACLQVAAASLKDLKETWLPASVQQYFVASPLRSPSALHVYTDSNLMPDGETLRVDVRIEQTQGEVLAIVHGLELRRHARSNSKRSITASVSPVAAAVFENSSQAASESESTLAEFLHAKVADVMGLTIAEIPLDQPLDSLGLDSLMAFELRDELERRYQISLPMDLFLEDITLRSFCQLVEEKISLQPSEGWVEGEI